MKIKSEEAAPYSPPRSRRYRARDRDLDRELVAKALAAVEDYYFNPHNAITGVESAAEYATLLTAGFPNEVFGAIFLDTRHRPIAAETLFNGTIDGAGVYPRVVAQRCFAHNAAAVIFYHNHPSGEPEPSRDDIALTERLKTVLAPLDIRVLDHLVIGGAKHVSLAERGVL